MINRVLIRMKAVQLLYSYLLVEKPFTLESHPAGRTKEKNFAYDLYLDLILLMDRVSHIVQGKNKRYPLTETKFVLKTEKSDQIRGLLGKYSSQPFPFASVEAHIAEVVRESLLFRSFEKQREEGVMTENFWEDVFNAVIMVDSRVNQIIRELPNYSLSGIDRMKVLMEETFKNFYSTRDNIDDALRTLEKSLNEARDLYMRLLALPVELTLLRNEQLELNRNKLLASNKDLNPNMRFVNNMIPKLLEDNKDFRDYIEKKHVSWRSEDPELLEILLKEILETDIYKIYEGVPVHNVRTDSEFWKDIFIQVILQNQHFLEYLENKSVFWNDDLETMMSFVLKTLKILEKPDKQEEAVMPMYKDGVDGKDAKFGSELFSYVVRNKELYRRYIQDALEQDKWNAERLAFMDIIITMTALAEILNYPEIPVSVSVNEYIEIAKSYSSAKSGQFIHGLLGTLISNLRDQGILNK